MKTQKNHKRVPFQSSTPVSEIEKKVDDILNAYTEVLGRRIKDGHHHNNKPYHQTKQPSVFYVNEKKQSNTTQQITNDDTPLVSSSHLFKRNTKNNIKKSTTNDRKEKKSIQVKRKKHIGIKKKKEKKEHTIPSIAKDKKSGKDPEVIPHFEEAIGQVKKEEATWLDKKIKETTGTEPSVQNTTFISEKTTISPPSSPLIPQRPSEENQSEAKKQIARTEKTVVTGFSPSSSDVASSSSSLSTEQVFAVQEEITQETEVKLDDITPDGQIHFLKEANQLKAFTLERMGYSENEIEEIDFYPISEPFSYVEIIREKESLDKRYVLLEMQLSKDEEYLLKFVQQTLDSFAFVTSDLESKGENKYLSEKVDLILEDYMLNIDSLTKKKLLYYLEKDSIGLGKLETIMKDPNIEDISCDGSGVSIFLYHRRYGSLKSNVQFNDEEELTAFVVKLAQKCGKHISISEPMLDATMPDGSRIQMTLSTEVTTKGSTFTIRKFSEDPFSPPDLIEFHTMSSEMVAYMWLAVENGINALIAGGTAAGKTSTLNALCLFIPRESKIVSIEETREINLPHPNWIPGVVRSGFGEVVGNKVIGEIDLYDLMKAALRQRPEYILVGEIRGKEAYVLFQAMATGHTTYSTFHADSAQSLIHRLEGKPIEIPRVMLQSLDIVTIQIQAELGDKRVRRCKQIVEIVDIDALTKEILTNEVFRWDPVTDQFFFSGKSYVMERIRNQHGMSKEEMLEELRRRVEILEWMRDNNVRAFKDVARIVSSYIDTPDDVMEKIRKDTREKEVQTDVHAE
jgi:type IV secretory pathway ATPase VirB11/archaellum biosynthesis ATPase